jgi:hypothetical protein
MMSHSRQKYFSADQEVLFLEITKWKQKNKDLDNVW